MSTSFTRAATIIVLSTLLSTTSVLTVMKYAPELVPMPYTPPDIIHESTVVINPILCPPDQWDWVSIPQLDTSFRVYQDSEVVVIFATKYTHAIESSSDMRVSYMQINAFMDGEEIPPGEDKLTEGHVGFSPQTLVYHANVKEGYHTLTFEWANTGEIGGYIVGTVVEVIAFPS